MKFKPWLKRLLPKQRLPWILLIFVTCLLLLLFVNRYLLFEKTISFMDKVDVSWMGYTDQKKIALTFDDGPDPVYTPKVLNILRKYHAPATFFLEGANVKRYPELVRRIIKDGHAIGNHTYTHPHLSTMRVSQIKAQITATDTVIRKICGKKPLFFRPPYEELTENILIICHRLHKQIILSTITLEHESVKAPKAKAERVIRLVFPGAIILAHDGRLNRSTTVEALPYLIKGLRAKGYRIVSIRELR
jgi:Predicted xylanase/chitin deacetylase